MIDGVWRTDSVFFRDVVLERLRNSENVPTSLPIKIPGELNGFKNKTHKFWNEGQWGRGFGRVWLVSGCNKITSYTCIKISNNKMNLKS